jgi:hypothetical protein
MAMLSNLTQGLYVTLIEAKHHGKLGISASFDYGPPRPTRRAQPPAAPSARWPRAPTRRPPAAPPRPPHARHGASLHVSYTRLNGRENSREGGGGTAAAPRAALHSAPQAPAWTPRSGFSHTTLSSQFRCSRAASRRRPPRAGRTSSSGSSSPRAPRTKWTRRVPPPRTKWTRRVPHPVLIGHAASLPGGLIFSVGKARGCSPRSPPPTRSVSRSTTPCPAPPRAPRAISGGVRCR